MHLILFPVGGPLIRHCLWPWPLASSVFKLGRGYLSGPPLAFESRLGAEEKVRGGSDPWQGPGCLLWWESPQEDPGSPGKKLTARNHWCHWGQKQPLFDSQRMKPQFYGCHGLKFSGNQTSESQPAHSPGGRPWAETSAETCQILKLQKLSNKGIC